MLFLGDEEIKLAFMGARVCCLESKECLNGGLVQLSPLIKSLALLGTTRYSSCPVQTCLRNLMKTMLKLALDVLCNFEAELHGGAESGEFDSDPSLACAELMDFICHFACHQPSVL